MGGNSLLFHDLDGFECLLSLLRGRQSVRELLAHLNTPPAAFSGQIIPGRATAGASEQPELSGAACVAHKPNHLPERCAFLPLRLSHTLALRHVASVQGKRSRPGCLAACADEVRLP